MLHPWKYITISGKLWTRKDSLEKQKWQNVEKEDFKKKIFSTTMLLNEKSVKIFRKILRYSLQKMKITTIATITMEKETTMKFTLAVSKKLFGLFGPRTEKIVLPSMDCLIRPLMPIFRLWQWIWSNLSRLWRLRYSRQWNSGTNQGNPNTAGRNPGKQRVFNFFIYLFLSV